MEDLKPEDQRTILRRVVVYKDVCDKVRRSTTGGLIFGGLMLFLWYAMPDAAKYKFFGLTYLILGCLELTVAMWNKFAPAPEGILFDGLVLIAFGAANVLRIGLPLLGVLPRQGGTSPIWILLGVWLLMQGVGHVRNYLFIRQLFPIRPTAEQIRWFHTLLLETRRADPALDRTALDLPTQPALRGKLLDGTAFLVQPDGEVLIVAREDFQIQMHAGDEVRKRIDAELRIEGVSFGDFDLDPDNYRNYTDWKKSA